MIKVKKNKYIDIIYELTKGIVNVCSSVTVVILTVYAFSFFYRQMTIPLPFNYILLIGNFFFTFWLAFRMIRINYLNWIEDVITTVLNSNKRR